MNGIPSASPAACSSSNTRGSSVEPRVSTGPEPNLWRPISFSSMPGASVANVTSTTIATSGCSEYAVVRAPPNVISSCATADRGDVAGRAAGLGHQPRGLERDEAAEPVVHRARDDAAVGQLDRLAGDHRDVADPHHRARLVAVLRADVDVQVAQLGRLLALLVLEQVDRLLADDAGDAPVARGDLDALADEDHRVPAADAGEPQEAVVVDVVDDQPDLVDVADDRDERAVAGARHARDRRADACRG